MHAHICTHTQISNLLKFSCPPCLEFVNLLNEVFSVGSGCWHHVFLLTAQNICVIHVPPAADIRSKWSSFLGYSQEFLQTEDYRAMTQMRTKSLQTC